MDGRLTSSSSMMTSGPTKYLRKRDAFAISTCILLLRLAFDPPSSFSSSSSSGGIGASMELAFYAPYPSNRVDVGGGGAVGRVAGPVPFDVDGDGIHDSIVMPARMTWSDAMAETSAGRGGKKMGADRRLRHDDSDVGGGGGIDEGLVDDESGGTWGLRVLNLRPLHRRGGGTAMDEAELAALGPFVPRTMFLSPLLPPSNDGEGEGGTSSTSSSSSTTYPTRLLPVQVPIRRTRLGEEERSRQRHRKEASVYTTTTTTATGGTSGTFGKNSAIPAKDSPLANNYDWTRHYFCGRDWHHAAQSCHRHCGGGLSSECGEGETCYADTPCDAHIELDDITDDKDDGESVTMALTKGGSLPGVVTVWSDGSVTLHVVTADIAPPTSPMMAGGDGHHRAKRAKQRQLNKRPELELRQLWRVYPLEWDTGSEHSGESAVVDFVELGIAFESGVVHGGVSSAASDKGKRRLGDNGAIILGARYTVLAKGQFHPLRVSFHALDAMTGTSLWELKGNQDPLKGKSKTSNAPLVPIIHTTSSARRRSHLPTTDTLDPELDNENSFVEGDDVMTSEECMVHFRASVLNGESGALPHEFWDDDELGSISVGRFDRSKWSPGSKWKGGGRKRLNLLNKSNGGKRHGDGIVKPRASTGKGMGVVGIKGDVNSGRNGPVVGGLSWRSDLIKRLVKQLRYDASHPHTGRPNVVLFHGREGLAVLSLKNGRPVCHVSLMDHSLYADIDQDGSIDTIQVITSPETSGKSSAVTSLINRFAAEVSKGKSQPDSQVICHALVTSGLPPREEVFTAPLCLGGPINPSRPHVAAAPPLLVEGSMGFGSDVVFAMNNGVVVRYDFNGREIWRKKGGLNDGTPSWYSGRSAAFLGRVQFGVTREAHSSVSASSHRNQHRPGSPLRPIILSGESGAALISPASGKVLASVVYPQSVSTQPLLADLSGDGTDDLLVASVDAIWGYRVVVETGRSGGFVLVVVTLLIGVALAALIHKTNIQPGQPPKRSTDA
ncbi:hypothetical protein ACHAXA_007442 [Cyclostephanos tholiformis]|uniref:FG-GAP repeat-containing protein n=1 Tax=Cyclostephanos tholiformis TaxID=382380 RepID=A0ABD3SD86_9STRA